MALSLGLICVLSLGMGGGLIGGLEYLGSSLDDRLLEYDSKPRWSMR